MWVVAGALLGATLLAGLVGFHAGPHVHLVAVGLGLAAALWLIVMAATGHAGAVLYVLLGADLTLSGGLGVGAYRAVRPGRGVERSARSRRLEGAEGVALSRLAPDGVVRVRGEEWSARAVNGPVDAGTPIQVIRADGVRLEVWADTEGTP